MRAFRFLNLTILSILLGASALLYAQDDKQQQDKPQQQQPQKQEPKKEEPKKQEQKTQQDESKRQDMTKPAQQDEMKPSKQEKQDQKQAEKQQRETDHGQPGRPVQAQRDANAHPAGKGGHIPDKQFHAHFGRSHSFRAQTVIVRGQPQFQYSGYTFELVDAWPAEWAYTDDCYIDYIDGEYFLIDLLHPGIRIAVIVVM
ncbi:MAG TPA: hypothetical protein VMU61_13215 [Candidatus Aquilonibacter sp.]|nr:hypothetical protein [Candidatus Aquilonibacter sp.]